MRLLAAICAALVLGEPLHGQAAPLRGMKSVSIAIFADTGFGIDTVHLRTIIEAELRKAGISIEEMTSRSPQTVTPMLLSVSAQQPYDTVYNKVVLYNYDLQVVQGYRRLMPPPDTLYLAGWRRQQSWLVAKPKLQEELVKLTEKYITFFINDFLKANPRR